MYLYEMLEVPSPPYPVIVDHVSYNSYIHTLKNLVGVNQVVMIGMGATFNYATWQDMMDKNILCLLCDTSLFCSCRFVIKIVGK
jgi:hypothetical protein